MAAAHGTALRADIGPGIRQLLHIATGMLRACRGRRREALEELSAAERLRSRLRARMRWRAS